jgi:transposase
MGIASRLGKNYLGFLFSCRTICGMTNRDFKTGQSRDQGSFLPARIEDYVGPDNPVRGIEAYVCCLDLAALGFRHTDSGSGAGQPPYDPADLLKLYLYGYLNRVRSSRRLEREAGRNVELMWLLRGLVPGYRTIGNFRKDNRDALKAVNRDFVLLARELDLLGGEVVAIDGAFFHGDASRASIVTQKRLAERLAALERDIEAYGAELDKNDAVETAAAAGAQSAGDMAHNMAQKLAALKEKRAKVDADLAQLKASGETQLSRTDADARLLSKNGQTGIRLPPWVTDGEAGARPGMQDARFASASVPMSFLPYGCGVEALAARAW